MGTVRCRDKAWQWVNLASAGAVPLSLVPIPGFSSTSLTAIEVALIYQVAKIYGVSLSQVDLTVLAGTIGVGSLALKAGVAEMLNFVPVAGWAAKAAIAPSVVRGIGGLVIKHFEDKYPGREFTAKEYPGAATTEKKDLVVTAKPESSQTH
ncbi:MAG: hypothetical protein AB2A00_36785 [Myxococcota bacterium]